MVISDILGKGSISLFSNLEHLISQSRLGVCKRSAAIFDLKSGCVTTENQPNADRFKVKIPYAGTHLQWEVIINHKHPEIPPDFIFGLSDTTFLPDIETVKSFENWNHQNPLALTDILTELLEEYRKHHLNLMKEHSRLQCEYSTILNSQNEFQFTPEDIEVHVTRKNGVIGQVNFMLKLPIEFSKLPIYLTKNTPGDDSALLLLTMESPDKGGVKPQLFLSPRIKQVLGPTENLAIPPFPNEGLLMDYIPNVCELLNNKVKQIISSYEMRRDFINCFLTYYERCVLEFDGDSFSEVSVLMEWHDFFFIVSINLPANFPTGALSLSWQSIYHENAEKKPYLFKETNLPYSPRWKPAEMVERVRQFIIEKVQEFQRKSVTEGRLSIH